MSFHVPELSRGGPTIKKDWHGTKADGNNGGFDIPSPRNGWRLGCVASDQEGWEHVSVHAYDVLMVRQRVPAWDEMCYVKKLFWDDEDVVMQLHPRESEYVNRNSNVLHLWRPTKVEIPTPPKDFVG